jgi:hypothetical protein
MTMKLVCLLIGCLAFGQSRDSIEKQLKSVEQQREAIRKMAPVRQAVPDCPPMPEEEFAPIIEDAAKAQHLPAKLLRAVAEQESAFRPCAVSEDGAQGLMQLMPATAAEFNVEDVFDPKANLAGGAAFLRQLLEKYKGDLPLSLAAYNAGPEVVDKSGIPDIAETRTYIEAITTAFGAKKIELTPLPKPEIRTPKP